jgi:hypothetical protein
MMRGVFAPYECTCVRERKHATLKIPWERTNYDSWSHNNIMFCWKLKILCAQRVQFKGNVHQWGTLAHIGPHWSIHFLFVRLHVPFSWRWYYAWLCKKCKLFYNVWSQWGSKSLIETHWTATSFPRSCGHVRFFLFFCVFQIALINEQHCATNCRNWCILTGSSDPRGLSSPRPLLFLLFHIFHCHT